MSDDLVRRLRDAGAGGYKWDGSLFVDAADRIEVQDSVIANWADQARKQHEAKDDLVTTQQQRIEALEAALREIRETPNGNEEDVHTCIETIGLIDTIARRALEGKKHE